jgi:hypothetical protein
MQIELLRPLVDAGKSSYQIAKELNSSATNIRYWLSKFKLSTKKPKQTLRERTIKNVICQRNRSIERKLKFIKSLGGCCSKCGYNKNWAVLEFHHRNPEKKEIQLSLERIGHMAEEKLLLEVEKCDLLCANCHRELHNPDKII